jgi:hypothetical protein
MRYVHHRPQQEAADLIGRRFAGAAGQLDALLGDPGSVEIGHRQDATPSD